MKAKVTGIILAGGKSKRMGQEKGKVKYLDKPLIEYALEALRPVCNEILISANANSYDYLGLPVIYDIIPNSGPMGGIYSCLLKSKNDINFVLSCDTPLVNEKIVTLLIEQLQENDVAMPWHGEQYFEPLCAVYQKSTIPVFEKFIKAGNFKIPDLLKEVKTNKVSTGKNAGLDSGLFFNVNSKKQLDELELKKLTGFANLQGFKNLGGLGSRLKHLPNLFMIAGTGRKVGKTTLTCKFIQRFSEENEVVGIKISPHMHDQADGQKIIAQTPDYLIIEETDADSQKDSSRMLRAGASKVYYLQTSDRNIEKAFQILMDLIPKNQPVICESGALLNYAKPGLFLLVKRTGQTDFKPDLDQLPYPPDRWVSFDGNGFDLGEGQAQYNGIEWIMPNE